MPGAIDETPQRPERPIDDRVTRPRGGRHRRLDPPPRHRRLAFLAAGALVLLGLGLLAVPLASRFTDGEPDRTPAVAGGVSGGSIGEPVPVIEVPAPLTPSGSPSTAVAPSSTPSTAPPTQARTTPTAPRPSASAAPSRATPSRTAPSRPPTASAPAPSVPTTSAAADPVTQVIALVNQERAAAGCPAVTAQPQLTEAARRHSEDQAAHKTLSHTGSDGSTPWERAERLGYDAAIGENVAAGYRTAEAVMAGWMNSPGHRANILNCAARAIGVGVAAADDGTLYWTQMFGSKV
ncbi:MAG TPA: CAP domain-containing protein [Micromonospora sp.]